MGYNGRGKRITLIFSFFIVFGDLAPTMLQLLGLEIPAEMDRESLIK